MRTTVALDDDVAALVDAERRRTGESTRQTINRLLRQSGHRGPDATPPALPLLQGRPRTDVRDVSAVLQDVDDEELKARRLY